MGSSKESQLNILAWDIEASNLSADFGVVLCVGLKTVGKGRPLVLDVGDYEGDILKREKQLLRDVRELLLNTDCWLTQFGTYYDIPFVNSRLLYHHLPILPPNHPHVDTWKVAKHKLRLRNNRLVTMSEFLGTRDEKNPILPEQWLRALSGDQRSLNYIIDHCRRDVLVLEQVYLRVRPLITDHPFSGQRGLCTICGPKSKVHYRGYHRTRTRVYRRYQCKCGKWDHEKTPVRVAG